MPAPGFDAEHSLYRTSAHYTGVYRFGGTASSLEPASVRCHRPGCERPEWLCPDNTFCANCGTCCSIGSIWCGPGRGCCDLLRGFACCAYMTPHGPAHTCCSPGTRCVHGADGQPERCASLCPPSYTPCGDYNCCPFLQCDPLTGSCTDPSKKCENCRRSADVTSSEIEYRCLSLGGNRRQCRVRASLFKVRALAPCDRFCRLPPRVLLPY
jgi:hypothetical protein